MNFDPPKIYATPPPPTFIGLFFSLGGWVLIETSLFLLHVQFQTHLIPTSMAMYLVFSSTRRMKLKQSLPESANRQASQRSSLGSQAGWASLLLLIGVFCGFLILSESLLTGVLATALIWIPWSRIAMYREHLVVSSAIAIFGMSLPLSIIHQSLSPISLLVFAWFFWLCSMCCIIRRIEMLWKTERRIKAMSAAPPTRLA